MSSDYNLPISATDILEKVISKEVKNIFRFGFINSETLEKLKSSCARDKGVFGNVKMSVCFELEDETLLCVSSAEEVNSISVDIISRNLLTDNEGAEDAVGSKFTLMNHDDINYGGVSYSRYLGSSIEKVQVVRQLRDDSKFLFWPNEVALLVSFKGLNGGLGVGLNLTKNSSWGVIQLIDENEISKDELIDYELVDIP